MKIPASRFLLAAAAFAAASPALAKCRLAECGFNIGTNSAFNVASMHEMQGGRWIVEAAPGYWMMNPGKGAGDAKGYTAGFAVKREFSEKWGAGVIASFARQDNTVTINEKSELVKDSVYNAPAGGQISGMHGHIIGLMATRDFMPNQDGHRLPFSFGLLYTQRGVKFNHEFTNGSSQRQVESVDYTHRSMGMFINASYDFLVHKDVRVMPGVFLAKGTGNIGSGAYFEPEYVVTTPAGTTRHKSQLSVTDAAPVLYTSFLYRPWGLSFDWNMTQLLLGKNGPGSSIYSFKLSKKFGA